jgi:hypothetical protein
LPLKGTVAKRGQAIFLDNSLGKCNICHSNAGAIAVVPPNTNLGNANFDTGVEALPDTPQRLTGQRIPIDDGFGVPGDRTFNTPSLVEAADTGPFFHNNAIETIEGAVAFFNGDAFKNSPSGQFLASIDPNKVAIKLDGTQVVAVAAFLRVINALENSRQAMQLLEDSVRQPPPRAEDPKDLLRRARVETDDAARVLASGGLHPHAVLHFEEALKLIDRAASYHSPDRAAVDGAIRAHSLARGDLVETR